jgi:hypothetical protein
MNASHEHSDALVRLTEATIDLGGLISQTVAHMALTGVQRGGEPPSQESIREVLTGLIGSVLAPLADEHPGDELRTAAGVLERAVDRIEDEILLVPTDEMLVPTDETG